MNKYEVTYLENENKSKEKVEANKFDYFTDCERLGVFFQNSTERITSIFFNVIKVILVK